MKTRSFQEFVRALVEHFNRERAVYAITGAIAASYYGIPRTTVDADFLVQVAPRETIGFLSRLEKIDVRVDLARVRRQLRAGYSVISVADKRSPYQADLIISKETPARRAGTLMGVRAYFQSPEALILAKLRMIKATRPVERSFKDREDVRQILANTKVSKRRLIERATEESTLSIFTRLLGSRP